MIRVDPSGLDATSPSSKTGSAIAVTVQGANKTSSSAVSVLEKALKGSENQSATITSGSRTSADQARIMYNNLEEYGVEAQKTLYASPGDKVIDVYDTAKKEGKSQEEIVQLMTSKIKTVGPSKVSKHCSDDYDVFDVSPSSIQNKEKFEKSLEKLKQEGEISEYLLPPTDPAYHIEIKKGQSDSSGQ